MNTKISRIGFSSIIFFISQTMFLHTGLNQLLNGSGNGSIYSILLGGLLSMIILFFIIRYFNFEKDLNLFKKNDKLFRSYGKIINVFLVIIFTFYFIYSLWSINTYVQNKYLDSTPSFIIILLFLIPAVWCASLNMKTISKVSISVFLVTVFIILFSILNLYSSIEINNLKPWFNTPIIKIIKDSILFTSYFVSPTFMLLVIPKNEIYESNKLSKTIIIFYIITIINFLLLFIFIIGVFGIDLARILSYPEYTLMKKVNFFDFIQHIENLSTIEWLYSIFISTVLSLFFIKEYLNYINKYNKKIFGFIIIISFITSLVLFNNTTIGSNFMMKYFIFIFFIPIIILLLISNIKIKKNKN
ncbi:MAG: GerAB/ArcD/ProY family transporter [Bacilli bacterium]|nr:GerAB/ArcD/ProY family transporter [Bacilli bacterium]